MNKAYMMAIGNNSLVLGYDASKPVPLRELLVRFEAAFIEQVLKESCGNRTQAGKKLSMNRTTLVMKLKKSSKK